MYEELLEYDKKCRALLSMQMKIKSSKKAKDVDVLYKELCSLKEAKKQKMDELNKLNAEYNAVLASAEECKAEYDTLLALIQKIKASFENGAESEQNYSDQFMSIHKRLQALHRTLVNLDRSAQIIAQSADECEKCIKEINKKGRAASEKHKPLSESLKAETEEMLSPLKAEKEQAARHVDSALREDYDKIAQSHPDPIAGVKNGCCFGCNMRLPAQVLSMASDNQMIHCSNCGRMLIRN